MSDPSKSGILDTLDARVELERASTRLRCAYDCMLRDEREDATTMMMHACDRLYRACTAQQREIADLARTVEGLRSVGDTRRRLT